MCVCQTDMEEELAIAFCVRGYHMYDIHSSCQGRANVWIWSPEHKGHAVAKLWVLLLHSFSGNHDGNLPIRNIPCIMYYASTFACHMPLCSFWHYESYNSQHALNIQNLTWAQALSFLRILDFADGLAACSHVPILVLWLISSLIVWTC